MSVPQTKLDEAPLLEPVEPPLLKLLLEPVGPELPLLVLPVELLLPELPPKLLPLGLIDPVLPLLVPLPELLPPEVLPLELLVFTDGGVTQRPASQTPAAGPVQS